MRQTHRSPCVYALAERPQKAVHHIARLFTAGIRSARVVLHRASACSSSLPGRQRGKVVFEGSCRPPSGPAAVVPPVVAGALPARVVNRRRLRTSSPAGGWFSAPSARCRAVCGRLLAAERISRSRFRVRVSSSSRRAHLDDDDRVSFFGGAMQRPRKPSLFDAPIWKSLPYSLWAALLDDVDTSDDDSESSLFSSRVSSEGCLSDTESESSSPNLCAAPSTLLDCWYSKSDRTSWILLSRRDRVSFAESDE
ncbi:hypothetical protein HPB51_025378 [Rhipicephalus microplus]|uniref:Uncharacterized protein n=1 Tax=Rhipicephalus microplus TaxID=6941 RepID=A0A9J6DDZ1_RHIMP|nr:hypothetical protein HPB51_025378 [Rhipicephalus microplus]